VHQLDIKVPNPSTTFQIISNLFSEVFKFLYHAKLCSKCCISNVFRVSKSCRMNLAEYIARMCEKAIFKRTITLKWILQEIGCKVVKLFELIHNKI